MNKMELSINGLYFRKIASSARTRTHAECARVCREAGFRLFDVGFSFLREPDWKERAKTFIDGIRSAGISIDQTHAPFGIRDLAEYRTLALRCAEASAMAGASNMVVHADPYSKGDGDFDADKALETAYEVYAPAVEFAAEAGMNIAVENLFEEKPDGVRRRYTSLVEEVLAAVERFGDDHVTVCWDFGHGKCTYSGGHLDALRKVSGRVTATHIHDNLWQRDMHSIPFLGDTDWDAAMTALREGGYSGRLTFELVYGSVPDELLYDYASLTYKTGRWLSGRFGEENQ